MKTVKVLIIKGLILYLGLNLQAQNIRYGFQAGFGINIPHVANNTYTNSRLFYNMACFNINGSIEYRFPGILGIAAEPGYIRKGGTVGGINRIMSEFKIQLNYIQLPILANLYCTDKLFISIGPGFAYLINKDGNLDFSQNAFSPFEENAFEISGLIGVNYCITKRIDLGLRNNHALTHFSVVSWTDFYGNTLAQSNVYNQYFQFIFRYKIKISADK